MIMHPTNPGKHLHVQSGEPAPTTALSKPTVRMSHLVTQRPIPPPIIIFCPIKAPRHPPKLRQENCSALVHHLLSHICHTWFKSMSEVREWCCSHISVDILWKLNTISLMNTARTKLCHLCAVKQMTIGHNFVHSERSKKIINLKIDMRGACTCKTRFLQFLQSD